MRKIKILIMITAMTVITVTRFQSETRAQSLSLSVSPPLTELIIKPGKSATQTFSLTSLGDPVTATVSLAELNSAGILNNPRFVPEKWITLLDSGVSLDNPFRLNKGETKKLVFRFAPPPEIPDGDLYRAVVVSTRPNQPIDTSQSSFSQGMVIPLLFSVTRTGELERNGKIASFRIPEIIDSFGPLDADIVIKNYGKSFFHPNGLLSFSGFAGKANYSIVPGVILSGDERKLVTDSNSLNNDHSISIKGFFIGKYTLTADLRIDESNQKLSDSRTVIALPLKLAGGMFFVLFVIINLKNPQKKK